VNQAIVHATAAAAVTIHPYRDEAPAWDAFVRRTPGGTFFHLSGWKAIIEESFGFRTRYLIARRAEAITGVLPLVELRSVTGRRSLLSLPFAVEGGVCADNSESQRALELAALDLGRSIGATSIELRDGLSAPEFRVREGLYYRFRRALHPSDEENMAAIPRKQRRMVRVGQQSGLRARIDPNDFDAFYDLYARSVRQLGTPVFPAHYLRRFLRQFPDDCVILTVRHDDTPVAAVMTFFFGDTVLPYYSGSRREYFKHAINDFMYWELMRHAVERGARVFDFGRSKKGTGAFDFKSHWGFAPEPLRYRNATTAPEAIVERSTSDRNLQMLRAAWQRVPLPLTKLIGPFFIRHFGAYYT
jgi:FemAB-related protein (PEP-CTERM system-associated)